MINQWWFQLYTLPILKELIKWTLISAVCVFGCGYFGLDGLEILCYLGPLTALSMKQGQPFANNIEFHKMSVPLFSLRKSFLKHNVIITFSVWFSYLILFSLSKGAIGQTVTELSTGRIIFYQIVGICVFSFGLTAMKDKRYKFYERKESFIINFLYSMAIGTGVSVVGGICLLIFGDEMLVATVAVFGITSGMLVYVYRAMFHLAPRVAPVKSVFGYSSAGLVLSFLVYLGCVFTSRHEVLDASLKNEARVSALMFNSFFNPPIDVETFKEIEKHTTYDFVARERLYQNLDFEPSSLGVEFYLEKGKRLGRLNTMLNLGRPNKEFLLSLYDHFEKHPDFWKDKKYVENTKYLSYRLWPKGEQLPEKYLAAKIETKKSIESRNRRTASETNP